MLRPLSLIAVLAALAAGPAIAQDTPPPSRPAAPPPESQGAPTHEMCKSIMGRQMDNKAVHDHGREKTGAPTWPNGKPLSAAEMEKMHKTCAEMMRKSETSPAKK